MAVVAVVAHHEEITLGHGDRSEVVPLAYLAGQDPRIDVDHVGLHLLHAVHVEGLVPDHHGLAAYRDAALDEVLADVLRIAEDDDVAGVRLPERGEAIVQELMAADPEVDLRAVEHLVDEQVIADEKGVLHRAGWDLIGLRHDATEGHDEQDAKYDRPGPFLDRGFGGGVGLPSPGCHRLIS